MAWKVQLAARLRRSGNRSSHRWLQNRQMAFVSKRRDRGIPCGSIKTTYDKQRSRRSCRSPGHCDIKQGVESDRKIAECCFDAWVQNGFTHQYRMDVSWSAKWARPASVA